MVEQIKTELSATGRSVLGKKVKQLRRDGLTPANIFGSNLSSEAIEVSTVSLVDVLKNQSSRNDIVYLIVDNTEARPMLIRNIQIHPTSDELLHVDFEQISLSERVKVDVPVALIGRSEAVDTLGGTILANLDSITVEAFPSDVPSEIEIDISVLEEIDASIRVRDYLPSSGIKILSDPQDLIARVSAPRAARPARGDADDDSIDVSTETEPTAATEEPQE